MNGKLALTRPNPCHIKMNVSRLRGGRGGGGRVKSVKVLSHYVLSHGQSFLSLSLFLFLCVHSFFLRCVFLSVLSTFTKSQHSFPLLFTFSMSVLCLSYFFYIFFCNYPPSSRIASCVGTAGTMTWRLHLTRTWCLALGQVLIWVVCPDWFEKHSYL